MENIKTHAWMLLQLLLCLSTPTASFSLPPALETAPVQTPAHDPAQAMVSSRVGTDVRLPCSCPTSGPKSVPHVQWCMDSIGPILEQRGHEKWTTEELLDRAEVPESGPGDCSLLLKDLQVTDRGQYHGYMIQDLDPNQTKSKTGIFICNVKLLVFAHSSVQSLRAGEDLVLELHTPHAMSLVFQHSNSTEWRPLWRRDGPSSHHVFEDRLKEQLSLRSVSAVDEGVYKVLDVNGLTVSSTWLNLDQRESDKSTSQKFTNGDIQRNTAAAVRSTSWPVLLLLFISVSLFAM